MTDSGKIQTYKAKIYDNLMKSITNAAMAQNILKTEFKPHIVHQLTLNNNPNEIKTISLKSSCARLNKSETCKEIIKSKLASLSNEFKGETKYKSPSPPPPPPTQPQLPTATQTITVSLDTNNILNSKSVGQIPSKYSSFTDYNKNKFVSVNKSSSKLNEIIANAASNNNNNTENKSFVSTTIPRDWKIINNTSGFYEDLYDYGSFATRMQPYEYPSKYLSFNYFKNENANSMMTMNDSPNVMEPKKSIETVSATLPSVEQKQQKIDNKTQRLNDYLVEMTNYYRNFNKMAAANACGAAGETNLII
jgi:hypothetical protein